MSGLCVSQDEAWRCRIWPLLADLERLLVSQVAELGPGRPTGSAELAQRLGRHERNVRQVLERLIIAGVLERSEPGPKNRCRLRISPDIAAAERGLLAKRRKRPVQVGLPLTKTEIRISDLCTQEPRSGSPTFAHKNRDPDHHDPDHRDPDHHLQPNLAAVTRSLACARLSPDQSPNDDEEIKLPPSDGLGLVGDSGRAGLGVGEGAKEIGPVHRRLIELAYELWPDWGSAPMDTYMAELVEIGAPLEQLERYLRAMERKLVPKDKGGMARCPPKLAGAVPRCRGWLRRDNAKQAEKAAQQAAEGAAAWRSVGVGPAGVDGNLVPVPAKPTFQKGIEAVVDGAPRPLDPHPAAGLPNRRPFQPPAGAPPRRMPIAPPEVDRCSPEVEALKAEFRRCGVDPDARRKATLAAPVGPFEAALAKIAGPVGLKSKPPGTSVGRLQGASKSPDGC